MPVAPTYPGVYIEEIPSGVRTIAGVGTSIALFVGRATQGSLTQPTLCLSYADFLRAYSDDARYSEMPQSVRLFFENGGTQCYIMRIAKDAKSSSVTLQNEGGSDTLALTAKSPGVVGDTIRAAVTYSGPRPEATFNIELFRWEKDSTGKLVQKDGELWSNLSMDPNSRRYAPTFITQSSKLVNAAAAVTPTAGVGYSQSGRPINFAAATDNDIFNATWAEVVSARTQFRLSVDGLAFMDIDLSTVGEVEGDDTDAREAALATAIQEAINPKLPAGKSVTVAFVPGPTVSGNTTSMLRISAAGADVLIQSSTDRDKDLAVALMLGESQGGLEVSAYAHARPAPTAITYKTIVASGDTLTHLWNFAGAAQSSLGQITIDGIEISLGSLVTTNASDPIYKDSTALSKNGNNDGVREKLGTIVSRFNIAAKGKSSYRAELWGLRLALVPTDGGENVVPSISSGVTTNLTNDFNKNVRYYSLGKGGKGLQTEGDAGSDGIAPDSDEYDKAYAIIDKEVDLWNLLVLPADKGNVDRELLWGPASVFCLNKRALLLMDAPDEWTSAQVATHPSDGVNGLRAGLVKTNSALFYPKLIINNGGLKETVSASGAIAGLMARIDASRGVWKAPAGMEADIRGVIGLNQRFSDLENGVLNPHGINTMRVFPFGIVNWGARTMDGDDAFGSEWKYIPVRRLALYLEESLYRGMQWAVFEPNDEPLWAQIRLNVGAFMQSLFRQGAFQGRSPREAYFVKCDRDTTTQDDINRGIVNVVVGFAPLKPAEFVIIKIQQMAGQLAA